MYIQDWQTNIFLLRFILWDDFELWNWTRVEGGIACSSLIGRQREADHVTLVFSFQIWMYIKRMLQNSVCNPSLYWVCLWASLHFLSKALFSSAMISSDKVIWGLWCLVFPHWGIVYPSQPFLMCHAALFWSGRQYFVGQCVNMCVRAHACLILSTHLFCSYSCYEFSIAFSHVRYLSFSADKTVGNCDRWWFCESNNRYVERWLESWILQSYIYRIVMVRRVTFLCQQCT